MLHENYDSAKKNREMNAGENYGCAKNARRFPLGQFAERNCSELIIKEFPWDVALHLALVCPKELYLWHLVSHTSSFQFECCL